MGFVFYDTETTGTDTSFDQILQFAAIRTDADLNEIERFEIRSRLLPHTVPAPGAMRVTKVTAAQLIDPSLPTHYEMIRRIRGKLLSWSPAIFVGYNSIEFDEHLFRHALYKTLHPPYLTNTNGNSRSDVMRMVHAASIFAPKSLALPVGERGQLVFKLDRVAPANGFNHDRAHDAMADVEAAIFLCRLLSERAPDVWSAFMRFSQKAAVADHVSTERIFCLSDFYFGRPYSWLVTMAGTNSENNSEFYVYDLAVAPSGLVDLTQAQLAARLNRSPKPLRRLRSNACPILMPAEDAPPIAAALQFGMDELQRRVDYLNSGNGLLERLVATFESIREERQPSPYVERQLYEGFFSNADQQLLELFHNVPWEERIAIIDKLEDRRLKIIGRQLVHIERPDLLPAAERADHNRAFARRLLGVEADAPWLTLPRALQEFDDLLAAAIAEEAELLLAHRQHLLEWSERARVLLTER